MSRNGVLQRGRVCEVKVELQEERLSLAANVAFLVASHDAESLKLMMTLLGMCRLTLAPLQPGT